MKVPKTLAVALLSAALGAMGMAAVGQVQPVRPVHGRFADLQWQALPEFGGAESVIYRSPDGKRVAAAFRESGVHTFTYPFDEFLVVIRGSVQVRVHGGETFVLNAGDFGYIQEGTTVELTFSDDFADVTMLMSDDEVRWR